MISPVCDYCTTPVDPNDGRTAQRIVGWETRSVDPSRRSGRDVLLREHLNTFACGTCLDRLKSGLNVNQEALL